MSRLKILLAILCMVLVQTVHPVQAKTKTQRAGQAYNRPLTKTEEAWVRKTLKAMTLEEKIAQMMTVPGNAVYFSRDDEDYKKLMKAVTEYKVGGVIFFRSDVWATAILTNRLQEAAKVPLLISSDLEMGMGMRLRDTNWWPPNMAVAATGDPKLARLQGELTAKQARAIGINWVFAPVADTNSNADNPVINVRSYSEDPATVGTYAAAFAAGAQDNGVIACAKHFPGHGDTAMDSHIGLPVIDVTKDRLESLELVPFRELAKQGIGSIMSAHISLPQIDPQPVAPLRKIEGREREAMDFQSRIESTAAKVTVPATLSSRVLTDILRNEIGFKGLVVTDSMTMAGVAARYEPADSAVRAIKAGIDMVLMCPDIPGAIAAVKQAVEKGEIPIDRINASAERVLRAKAALGLTTRRTVDVTRVDTVVDNNEVITAAQEIADRSVTVLRDDQGTLQMLRDAEPGRKKICLVVFNGNGDDDLAGNLADLYRKTGEKFSVTRLVLDPRSTEEEVKRATTALDGGQFDAVVFAVSIRVRSGRGSVALPKIGMSLLTELRARNLPLVVASLGNPYLLAAMPDVPCYFTTYGGNTVSQIAAGRTLTGEIAVGGKLPVSIPGIYQRGAGIELKKK